MISRAMWFSMLLQLKNIKKSWVTI
jgi:hypothetical protein